MLVLALDTATATPAVAVVDTAGAFAPVVRTVLAGRGHGELLAPLVQECLEEARARPVDLGLVVVGRGPGPFTGLRVGLVTGRTLGLALGLPVVGVCSHDVIAAAAIAAGFPAPLLVVTDALRREVHWSRYEGLGLRVAGPSVGSPASVGDGALPAVGAGAARYPDVFTHTVPGFDAPDPALLAELGHERWVASVPSPPDPIYLRRPDAVPNPVPKAVMPR